jgi:tripartite-type tricarboxylate transporter receptor subunit TctC
VETITMFDKAKRFAGPIGGTVAVMAACMVAISSPARAQDATFAPKGVTMLIGFGAGGGYDQWGRIVARHIGKYLPGKPHVVAQNMPGGGSFTAANHIFTVAPKDGTVMAIIARDAPLGPLSGMAGARFDPLTLTWIGSPTTETNVCFAHKRAKVQNFDDLLRHELIIGNTGAGTGTYTYPKGLNGLLGTKFKLVSGFKASTEVLLAIERGEVDGLCESWDSAYSKRAELFKDGTFKVLFQAGPTVEAEIKAPSIFTLAKSPEHKLALEFLYAGQGIGRPFVAPPDMPADRLKIVRDAFNAAVRDPEFLADAKKGNLDVHPVDGQALDQLIRRIYATPKHIVEQVGALIK